MPRPLVAPALSIVVPTLDEADAVVGTLTTLAPLRQSGCEVIVVDGGSRDATRSLAAPLVDRIVVAPRGRAAQMNAGARVARGDALVFLHADTRLPPDAPDRIAAALRGSQWGRFDVRIEGRSALLPIVARSMNLRSRVTGMATGDQAMFVRRATFEAVGGFPDIALMEDIELSRRLRRAAGRPACIGAPVVTSGRRWDTHGAWRTIVQMWRLRFAYWRGVAPDALARRYSGRALPALLVLTKDPAPGRVKTRLVEHLGAGAAARLHAELVERTLLNATRARDAGVVGDVIVHGTPAIDTPAFARWQARYGVALAAQCEGDLGARMREALGNALRRGSHALLIGSDAPAIDTSYLARAVEALRTHDAVVGPAEDGGYVLIGMRRPLDIFDDVTWSGPDVMATTRGRLRSAGASWVELPTLWDVDRPADLERWRRLARESGQASVLTRSVQDQL
jgi:rSAM/selenodomain-associated transferase 2/rSAM/selenodomain-associated transferase 1